MFKIIVILIIGILIITLISIKGEIFTINDNKITKIQFKDFWGGFKHNNNYFTDLFKKYNYKYQIVDEKPDILLFSVFGDYYKGDLNNNIKNVFYTGENKDIKIVEKAEVNLTFENTLKYNNIRLPLWILYAHDKDCKLTKKDTDKFCCFVYSNNVGFRDNFCKKLSNYKIVDCGGGSLNNIGYKVKNKIEFQTKYKFCIAYENSLHPGYTTEKILEAYNSNCIPIYKGSNTIYNDFNPDTFINAHDFNNDEELIEYIKRVDNDDKLYNSFMNKPIYSNKWLEILNDPDEKYFRNIVKKVME